MPAVPRNGTFRITEAWSQDLSPLVFHKLSQHPLGHIGATENSAHPLSAAKTDSPQASYRRYAQDPGRFDEETKVPAR